MKVREERMERAEEERQDEERQDEERLGQVKSRSDSVRLRKSAPEKKVKKCRKVMKRVNHKSD